MTNSYDHLRELVEREIGEIGKRGELDDMSLEHAYKLVDILKDLGEIDEQEVGYSERYMDRNRYSMRHRDSMGRYARNYGNSYRYGEDMM